MKLSNKILIGFFGFIFIYLTAVFAEVRFRGTPNVMDDTNSIAETADISGVTHIILRDLDKNVYVTGSDQPRLEVRSFSGDLLQKMKYKVSGDTLTLSELQSKDIKAVIISVFVPKSGLKGLTVNSAVGIVKGLDQDHLYISQNAGRIWMSDSSIGTIHIEGSAKSFLNMSSTNLDTLQATIEESQVQIWSSVRLLKGSMKNNSYFRIHNIEEIQFKKDESSNLNLY